MFRSISLPRRVERPGSAKNATRQVPRPFDRVTISVSDAAGRPLRYDADKEVLTSVVSVDAVRGFYVIGGTRILLLDIIIALALLAGIAGPIAHLTLSWLFRRYAKRIGGREDS